MIFTYIVLALDVVCFTMPFVFVEDDFHTEDSGCRKEELSR